MCAICRSNALVKSANLELEHVTLCLFVVGREDNISVVEDSAAKLNELVEETTMNLALDCGSFLQVVKHPALAKITKGSKD